MIDAKHLRPKRWADENGNVATLHVWGTEVKAKASLMTLRDCYNCTDCEGCVSCANCTGCTECVDCISCVWSEVCANCSTCEGCMACETCKNMTDAIDQKGSDGRKFTTKKKVKANA